MESVNDMRIKNGLMLLLTAFIWGTAFVASECGDGLSGTVYI